MPLLSIVIPTYNSEAYVAEALTSIPSLPELEIVVVDNQSEDRTLEVIESSGRAVDHIISEKDRGQAHAINKGIRVSSGRYVTWLNADDRYCEGALEKLCPLLNEESEDWIAGNMVWVDQDNRLLMKRMGEPCSPYFIKRGYLQVYGPSTFFRRELYEEAGPLDEDFRYKLDTEYWYRLFDLGYRFHRVPWYVWAFRVHGNSRTGPSILQGEENERQQEEQRMIENRYNLRNNRLNKQLYNLYRFGHWPYVKSYIQSLFPHS